ncbi:MAG: hypothetical protein GX628_08355 [Clostridiales bacterium]|nr:hypothetical protein [Clostridiales bacterium]
MKLKSVSVIAVLVLTAVLLSSCGSRSGGGADITSAAGTEGSDATETSVTKPIDTLPQADYDGYVFNIFGATESATLGRAGTHDYFYMEQETGEPVDDAVYQRNAKVSEMYNMEFAFHLEDWGASKAAMEANVLAGDSTYDLYTNKLLRMGSLIASKYMVSWEDIPNIDLDAEWFVQNANRTYSLGGNTVMLFGDYMETNILRCWNMAYNKTLAADYGIGDLYGTVIDGGWTIDYLSELSKDISRDLDGDGVFTEADQYGLITDKLATIDAFSRSLGFTAVAKDEDDLPVLAFWNDNTVTAYEKLYSLYWDNAGTYVHKDSLGQIKTMFAPGRGVFCTFRIDFLMQPYMRDMEDDYGVLPYPKLNEKQENYATYLSGTFSPQMVTITQPEEDWERTGVITTALNAYGHEWVTPAIYEVTLKTKTARDEESLAMFDLILDNRVYSFDACDESAFPLSPLNALRNRIGGSKSPDIASYYASVEASAQAWLDKIIEQYQK